MHSQQKLDPKRIISNTELDATRNKVCVHVPFHTQQNILITAIKTHIIFLAYFYERDPALAR